jgi:hypothetical protein
MEKIINENEHLHTTSRQPCNAGGFRRLALTKPANDIGNEKKQHVTPALRLPAGRYASKISGVWLNEIFYNFE